jgi:translocation and assembly module TamB
VKKFFAHPLTQKTRTILRRVVATTAVILAVVVVTTVSIDLGPALRARAETAAANYLKRTVHIGGLSVRLWNGRYQVHDFTIGGLTPDSPPFLSAKLITVSMPWSTLFTRRIVFDTIEMTDWKMVVENLLDGRNSFPRLPPRQASGPRTWTTTLQYVRAHRGEFVYDDKTTPWKVIARNLDVTVSKPGDDDYTGTAKFSNGLVAIQNYVPFRTDMDTRFTIAGGRVLLDPINLVTDGTRSVLKGDVNMSYWPEQMYSVKSTIDLPRMRQLFFANNDFELAGAATFDGVFHLFKDFRPDGTTRTGRELKGNFQSATAFVDKYRFDGLRGYVRWIPEALEVHDASAQVYGGSANFEYAMAPLGRRDVRPVNRFDASYENVDLTTLSDVFELQGIRMAGQIAGQNLLEWPSGRFAERRGGGEMRLTPPAGVSLMARDGAPARAPSSESRVPDLRPLQEPVPIGGTLTYQFDPAWIDIGPSRIATETTYVEFEGRTAYGEQSEIPFHVSSADWQESDRLFVGMLTAFGAPTRVIAIGGRGTFDGVMRNAFRRPRIEGKFTGEEMRAFDVVWGTVQGDAVIENSYADVTNVVVTSGPSTIRTDGRFSLGFPRRDGGEQINARIRIEQRPISDLRHAFGLDDYNLDGIFSGEFHVFGDYQRPLGFGALTITDGVAYGERFESANGGVLLEGSGVRLDNIQIAKGGGRGTGAAFVGWNGTYAFNFEGSNIPVEALDATSRSALPLSGLIDVTAGGSGRFAKPQYEARLTVRDLFVADEGVGRVFGVLSIDGDRLTIKMDAASARLAVSGGGRIELTDAMDAELSFSITDTSLDPYIRAFQPRLSPYTNAVASGTIRVYGQLSDIDRLSVDATVDRLDARLFDYALRNATPIRLALDRHSVRVTEMRLTGQDTELDVSGVVDLHNEQIRMRTNGNANLGILQGFMANIRSSGRAALAATLEGAMRDPVVSGKMTVENGRIRHFGLPHALDNINGVVGFDTRGIRLDELTGRIGNGPVQFGGAIGIEGYRLGRVDVTMLGEGMVVRFPQDMRSTIDADLALQGTVDAMMLNGNVTVRDALYTGNFGSGRGFLDLGGDDRVTVAAVPESTLPLTYDVRIRAPSSLRVRNDLMSQVVASADLRLAGTYARPLVFGRIDVERGEVDFEGKRYIVRRGTIDFNHPTRIEPFFDIETEALVRVPGETYRVTVRAVGTDPVRGLTFSSDPELPQYELLALLVADIPPGQDVEFRQYSDITPQQQLFRERVSRALTGVVSSPIGRAVEQALGCDTFQLSTSLLDVNQQSARLDPAARVTCGKRLRDNIFLTYSRSLSSATRDQIIMLEIDQTDRLTWILSRNEDGTYALDLRLRRTF